MPMDATAQQLYEGSGVVSSAKCAGASVFRDQDGKSFEIDNSRVALPKGTPLTIRGKVYPRISVCRVFPWLDVVGTSFSDLATRNSSGMEAAPAGDENGVIEMSIGRQEFATAAVWLARLAVRSDVSKIRIQIPDGAAEQLPHLVLSLRAAAPDAIAKAEISVVSNGHLTFTWTSQGTKKTYLSFSELRNALNF